MSRTKGAVIETMSDPLVKDGYFGLIRAVAMYNFMHNKYDDLVDAGVHMMTIFADDEWGC